MPKLGVGALALQRRDMALRIERQRFMEILPQPKEPSVGQFVKTSGSRWGGRPRRRVGPARCLRRPQQALDVLDALENLEKPVAHATSQAGSCGPVEVTVLAASLKTLPNRPAGRRRVAGWLPLRARA